MRASKAFIPVGIAGLVAALAFQQWTHQRDLRRFEARIEKLGQRDDRPGPLVEVVRHAPPPVPKAAAPATEEPGREKAAEEEPQKALPEQPPPAPPEPAEIAQRFDAAFRSERVDATWEAEARPRLQTSVSAAAKAAGATMRSMACRGSMCRLEVEVDDRTQIQGFFDTLHAPESRPWNGAMFTRVEPDGDRYVATSYLLREGVDLPEIVAAD